jgi:hypothetical protein
MADSVRLSVVVVSDYAAGEEKSWEDLRRAFREWAAQEGPGADEFLLVESAQLEGKIPEDVLAMVHGLRVLYLDGETSYELKNRAVEAATGDWVAIVDADCIPRRSWLRALRASIGRNPGAAVISSKTTYPGRSTMERILGLITRSFIDPGRRGRTRFISGNAACYRREIYLRHPLPLKLGAFAGRIQSEAILRAGGELLFEPDMLVVHDFEGWPMERDIRRNHGFCTVATRLKDERLPYAGLIRLGIGAVPLVVAAKMLDSVRVSFRCYRQYDVKMFELPLVLAMIAVTHVMEVPGMIAAYQGQATAGATAYR